MSRISSFNPFSVPAFAFQKAIMGAQGYHYIVIFLIGCTVRGKLREKKRIIIELCQVIGIWSTAQWSSVRTGITSALLRNTNGVSSDLFTAGNSCYAFRKKRTLHFGHREKKGDHGRQYTDCVIHPESCVITSFCHGALLGFKK